MLKSWTNERRRSLEPVAASAKIPVHLSSGKSDVSADSTASLLVGLRDAPSPILDPIMLDKGMNNS
jgi:hypothetical protein